MCDCRCYGDCLPCWCGCYLHGAGDNGSNGLNLNLRVQDMGWYSLAAVEDGYFSGQGNGGGGDKAECVEFRIIIRQWLH